MFDREKCIEVLINDDFDAIINCGSYDYLYDILHSGHIGYDNFTDNELVDECAERDIPYEFGENE